MNDNLKQFHKYSKMCFKTILKMFELGNNRDNHYQDGSQKYII